MVHTAHGLDLSPRLREVAVLPQDAGYRNHASTFFRSGTPAAVLRARTVQDVQEAIALGAANPEMPFSVRSGGHGITGRSTNNGGIVLDLAGLNRIELLDSDVVRVGPGARWIDVARFLEPHGLGISSGDYGGVGVGGLATAGGAGWLVRERGLTIDQVHGVDLVLADAAHVRADGTEHTDLYWGVRGAGASLGVATSFDIQAAPVSQVGYSQMVLVGDDVPSLLTGWGHALESAPRAVTSSLILGPSRPGRLAVAQVNTVVHSDQPDDIGDMLSPFAAVGQVAQHNAQLTPYRAVIDNVYPGPHQGMGEPHSRAAVLNHITDDVARGFTDLMASGQAHYFQIRALGGAVADTAADATAFAHRDANFLPAVLGSSRDGLNRAWDKLRPHFDGLYSTFDTDERPERLLEAYPAPALTRLRNLKNTYDPHHVFRDNRALHTP
jgi:FAD/FMN-containing dehydrogenase